MGISLMLYSEEQIEEMLNNKKFPEKELLINNLIYCNPDFVVVKDLEEWNCEDICKAILSELRL